MSDTYKEAGACGGHLCPKNMKHAFLFASMAIASGLLLTNIYTSLVDVPAWSHNIPASIDTARQYYSHSNPGTFFRIFSPLNQGLGLLCLLLFWKRTRQVRLLLSAAFLLYVVGEGMTFMYFYPRNAILFGAQHTNVDTLQTTITQWRSMNWMRSLVIAAGVVCSALALHNTYQLSSSRKHRTLSQTAESVVAL
jgi:hypothetical protein